MKLCHMLGKQKQKVTEFSKEKLTCEQVSALFWPNYGCWETGKTKLAEDRHGRSVKALGSRELFEPTLQYKQAEETVWTKGERFERLTHLCKG